MARTRIGVVGAGQVGATTALYLAQAELGDVGLVDIMEGIPQGKGLDLDETAPVQGYDSNVRGSNTYEVIEGASVVVVTAGFPRKPGMDRMDLLRKNAEVVGGVVDQIRERAPQAVVVMVTNPLDVMCYLGKKRTGWDRNRVIGMAGVLDSARFCWFIAEALKVSVKDVRAMVLGGHGDSMVPLPRYSTVSGIPITDLLDAATVKKLSDRTRNGGAEIVNLLKSGSAYYAPAASVVAMVGSILRDERRILPSCVWLNGEYGQQKVYAGVPAILGANGVEKVVELPLNPEEKAAFQASCDGVRKGQSEIDEILAG